MTHILRRLTVEDAGEVLSLYRAVAKQRAGIARELVEVDDTYALGFLTKGEQSGLSIGAYGGDRLCGEIHAARSGLLRFQHVLTDLTVAVHPSHQGRGLGRRLFEALFAAAEQWTPRIQRIELMVQAENTDALHLYQSLGFQIEGRLVGRVRFLDGRAGDDLILGRVDRALSGGS